MGGIYGGVGGIYGCGCKEAYRFPQNGADLIVNERQKIGCARSTEKEEERRRRIPNCEFLRGAYVKLRYNL